MSRKLIELEDYSITDDGETVVTYDFLVKKALSGEPFFQYLAEFHQDIQRFNQRSPETPIQFWQEGNPEGPPEDSYQWVIPKKYQELDVEEYVIQKMEERGLDDEVYVDRIVYELSEMKRRGHFPFIQCIIHVLDTFHRNGVVWGVGRGSSCASLLYYVIGVNKVDPIEYDIPIKEFLK